MKSLIKSLKKIFGIFVTSFIFFFLAFSSLREPIQPYSNEVASNSYSLGEKQAVRRSTNSVVQIMSLKLESMAVSFLSGTYFTFGGNYYVLTSAHGIVGGCETIKVVYLERYTDCLKIVAIDYSTDYAIIKTNRIASRTPIRIPQALANWRKSYNLLDRTYYTGYPNSNGPTTWIGTIAGSTADNLILQSYAWPGSSGAGVFDERGQLIGIVMGLDVGKSRFGYDVLEDFVIIVPVWSIDFSPLLKE
jgi:S1-C subfamily serine protease